MAPPVEHANPAPGEDNSPKYLDSKADLGIIAVGFSGGQSKAGVDSAPAALMRAGLLTDIKEMGYKTHYDGVVHNYSSVLPESDPPIDKMLNPIAVSNVTKALSGQVYNYARNGMLTLTIGGDHSIAIGSISGSAKATKERTGKRLGVIWVDAHADINTPESTESGNIHGMPVAFLTGIAEHPVFDWITPEMRIDRDRIVYIALRDVDRAEKKILKENKIKAFSMHDVDRHGIGKVVDMALDYLRETSGESDNKTGPLYLSFDVDALDPSYAPSTGTPVRGGLTLREGDFICEAVHETGSLVGIDLVEVNVLLDEQGENGPGAMETVKTGCSLVRCALGESLL